MALINEFIEDYKKNIKDFEQLANVCAEQCERGLKRQGFRALVTFRVKKLDSLMDKVDNRAKDKSYNTIPEIYDDIVDLVGVRIALYFPGDWDKVNAFICSKFNVEQIKDFPEDNNKHLPYQKRFLGYSARHYRLYLKPETLQPDELHLANKVIELQMGSVLMHAWAEIEHDLIYKATAGFLSQNEYAILDELNGLMHAGEIALQRLKNASKRRITSELEPFCNHYDLTSYLYDYARKVTYEEEAKLSIGRTDILFHFLNTISLNNSSGLAPFLKKCNFLSADQPVTQQIIDQILLAEPDYYAIYNNAQLAVARRDNLQKSDEFTACFTQDCNISLFMKQWIMTERILGESLHYNSEQSLPSPLDEQNFQKLRLAKKLRDTILYGNTMPDEKALQAGEKFLQELIHLTKKPNQVITMIDESIAK